MLFRLPKLGSSVIRTRDKVTTKRWELDIPDGVWVSVENTNKVPLLQWPEPDSAILRARYKPFVINWDIDAINRTRVSHKNVVPLLFLFFLFLLAFSNPNCSRRQIDNLLPSLSWYLFDNVRRNISLLLAWASRNQLLLDVFRSHYVELFRVNQLENLY